MIRRPGPWTALALVLLCTIAYLRDPPWLLRVESGFRAWENGIDGTRSRWIGGHASFFVPAGAASLVMPVRTTFAAADEPPTTLSVTVDDRSAAVAVIASPGWHQVTVPLPRGGTRRVRRIDVRVDRTRPGNRGAQIGEIRLRPSGG
jgi:hypothetical protein